MTPIGDPLLFFVDPKGLIGDPQNCVFGDPRVVIGDPQNCVFGDPTHVIGDPKFLKKFKNQNLIKIFSNYDRVSKTSLRCVFSNSNTRLSI